MSLLGLLGHLRPSQATSGHLRPHAALMACKLEPRFIASWYTTSPSWYWYTMPHKVYLCLISVHALALPQHSSLAAIALTFSATSAPCPSPSAFHCGLPYFFHGYMSKFVYLHRLLATNTMLTVTKKMLSLI